MTADLHFAFAHSPLDRAGNARRDPDFVAAQAAHPEARLLPVTGDGVLLSADGAALGWLTMAARTLLPTSAETVFLGLDGDRPCFAIDAAGAEEALAGLGEITSLRRAAMSLTPPALSMAGQAFWLFSWHRAHRFCARHGSETVMGEGGYKRVHPVTGTEHFPRTDPVAIMLPVHEDNVCMGRGPHFPEGFVSAFAGYVEPCESLEQCAIRELKEETGLTVTNLTYVGSQPWPFPSSLMCGFIADVATPDLHLDPQEIEEAHWFTRDEAARLLSGDGHGDKFAPPPFTIAHQLLKFWLAR